MNIFERNVQGAVSVFDNQSLKAPVLLIEYSDRLSSDHINKINYPYKKGNWGKTTYRLHTESFGKF